MQTKREIQLFYKKLDNADGEQEIELIMRSI